MQALKSQPKESSSQALQRWIQRAGYGRRASLKKRVELEYPPELVVRALREENTGEYHGTRTETFAQGPSDVATYYDVDTEELIAEFIACCSEVDCVDASTTNIEFAAFWRAWASVATSRLKNELPDETVIPTAVLQQFHIALRQDMWHSAKRPLLELKRAHKAIYNFRKRNGGGSDDVSEAVGLEISFMQRVMEDPADYLFSEFPELGRILATRLQYWVESVAEFFRRLESDRDRIEEVAAVWGDGEVGDMVNVEVSLSDPHRRGRVVLIPEFASGFKIVYKPRPVDVDEAFYAFAAWMKKEGGPEIRVPRTLSSGHYGWAEYVEQSTLEVSPETYYHRAGELLGTMHVLRGKDYHYENIVATSTHPVPIDLEILCAPDPPFVNGPAAARRHTSPEEMAMSTGLLPNWRRIGGAVWEIGGLTGKGESEKSTRGSRTTETIKTGYKELDTYPNLPVSDEGDEDLIDYVPEFLDGFSSAYRFFESRKQQLCADDGPLSVFCGAQTRFLFRPTSAYGSMRIQSSRPPLLRDRQARDLELDLLFRPLLTPGRDLTEWAPIIHAEKAALDILDVPVFDHTVDGTDLYTPTETVPDFFAVSGLDRVHEQIKTLSESDLHWQISAIRGAVYTRITDGITDIAVRRRSIKSATPDNNRAAAYGEADAIATSIQEGLSTVGSGQRIWTQIDLDPETRRLRALPAINGLHGGYAGVALFLAAHGALHDDPSTKSIAEPIYRRLIEQGRIAPSSVVLGGTRGISSIIYSATEGSRLLDHPEWLPELVLLAECIEPSAIAADGVLDVTGGSAGTVLSLLHLYRATNSTSVLERAIACGDHLLNQRVEHGTHRIWKGMEGNADIGYAHGNAGIGFAIDRLARATGESRFADAARETWEYIWSRYDATEMAWTETEDLGGTPRRLGPDGEADYDALAGDSWCRGNTGVALTLFLADTERAVERVDERIFDRILNVTNERCDHVCCGTFGRISSVLAIARHLGDGDLERRAALQAQKSTPSSDECYTPQYGIGYFDPGLYTGLSGIGMTHLSIAHPEEAPSVLIWS